MKKLFSSWSSDIQMGSSHDATPDQDYMTSFIDLLYDAI